MEEPDLLALDNQVCFALYAANRAVTARYRPLLAELGLTYPQYLAMLVLWEADSTGERVRVSDLGRRLRLDSGTLTPLLKRLESQGLVHRRREMDDQRTVVLGLSEAGRALRQQAQEVPARLLCDTGVAPERVAALRDELRALLSRLEAGASSSAR